MAESAKKIRVITLTRVLCALALAGAAAHYLPMQWFFPSQTTHPAFFQLKAASHTNSSSPFGHPYYRYSVIPGGAYTAEELKTALAHDSVAASHYAGFHVDETHIVTLQSDRVCYVSYRVGDKLYWTRRPITLHKGETLLTDGVHYARTRCGNRVADTSSSAIGGHHRAGRACVRSAGDDSDGMDDENAGNRCRSRCPLSDCGQPNNGTAGAAGKPGETSDTRTAGRY